MIPQRNICCPSHSKQLVVLVALGLLNAYHVRGEDDEGDTRTRGGGEGNDEGSARTRTRTSHQTREDERARPKGRTGARMREKTRRTSSYVVTRWMKTRMVRVRGEGEDEDERNNVTTRCGIASLSPHEDKRGRGRRQGRDEGGRGRGRVYRHGGARLFQFSQPYTPDRKKASNEIEISNYLLVIVPVSSK